MAISRFDVEAGFSISDFDTGTEDFTVTTGTVDPNTDSAKDGFPLGSLATDNTNGNLWRKETAGSNGWVLDAGADSGVDEAIFITDITSPGTTNLVREAAPNEEVVDTGSTDNFNLTVSVEWDRKHTIYEGTPTISWFIGAVEQASVPIDVGTVVNEYGTFTGSADIVVSSAVTKVVATFATVSHEVPFTELPKPEFTVNWVNGYPGAQTEVNSTGDTYDVFITHTNPAVAGTVTSIDFEGIGGTAANALNTQSFVVNLTVGSPTVTLSPTVGNLGVLPVLRDDKIRGTSTTGSTSDFQLIPTTDRPLCNNVFPQFTDNGYTNTSNPGFTAFKGVEQGDVDVEVTEILAGDVAGVAYSSPHGDFTVPTPGYVQVKTITCTNPGDYNDSLDNYRIDATRAANGHSSQFNKVIEVADTAPAIVVTQPVSSMRSGGNNGTSEQTYLITATSDQNLVSNPDIQPNDTFYGTGTGGTFLGGAPFAGGPKISTRTISISDDDTVGTAAWEFVSTAPTNNAGTAATLSGDETIGGFVSRVLTLEAFLDESSVLNATISDYSNFNMTWNVKTMDTNPQALNTDSPPSLTEGWAVAGTAAGSGVATGSVVRILDIPAFGGSSQQSFLTVEEVI